MSWECPYLINEKCEKLKKLCQPLQKGCELESKVRFIGLEGIKRQEDDRCKHGKEKRYQGDPC